MKRGLRRNTVDTGWDLSKKEEEYLIVSSHALVPLLECEDVGERITRLRYTLDNTDSEYFDIETLDGLINNCYKLIESCKANIRLIDLANE